MIRLILAVLLSLGLVVGLAAAPVLAEDSVYPHVPKPLIGEPHPEGNEYMRINHPKLLRHDRDLTVLEGDRTISNSLKGCLTCHAVNGPDEQPVGAEDGAFFCQVCHAYAAVRIDCFQCHTSKPDQEFQALLKTSEIEALADPNDIANYLKEASE